MSIDHNRIKVADLETNQPNKVLATNDSGILEFKDITDFNSESYNGIDYTQPGKVLDARQGKTLKDFIDLKVDKVASHYIGTTAISNTRTSASQTLSGVSIDGNAATVTNGLYSTGSYSNPSWMTSLGWSKITGRPTTLSGYGITDAITGSGSANAIPKFSSALGLTSSLISDNGSAVTIGGALTVNNNSTINGTLTATKLKYANVDNYSNQDLNALYVGGHYSGSSMTNAPDNGWWWIEVVVESSGYFFQRATSQGLGGTYPKGTMFQRAYSGGWTNWQKIILEDVSTGLVDTVTSKNTYNRGSWNIPTKGVITQITDNSGSQHSVIVGLKSNGTTRSYGIDFLDSDTSPEMRLYGGTGYVAINSTSTTVSGTLNAIGDVIAYSSSDERLKDNIKPIKKTLEKLSKLSGYEFDWNDNQETYSGHDIGVIAQEVEAIFPELVVTRDNGYKAVKYDKLVAVLISAINELSNEVELLKHK